MVALVLAQAMREIWRRQPRMKRNFEGYQAAKRVLGIEQHKAVEST